MPIASILFLFLLPQAAAKPDQTQKAPQTTVSLNPIVPAKYKAPIPAADAVVATVNGIPIHAGDAEGLLWDWRGPEVTEDLITLLMVRDAAAKQGLSATQAEIEAKLNENLQAAELQKKQNAQDPNPGVSARVALAKQGFPLARLYVRSEFEVLIDKLALKDFKQTDYVKVSTMIFRAEGTTADAITNSAKKAQAAYDKLKAGESWDKVLESSGADPAMVKQHGVLGWRRLAAFPEVLQKEIPTLKPGQFTQPRQLPAGFQIFRIETPGAQATPADLEILKKQIIAAARPGIIGTLQNSTKIERFPVKEPADTAAPGH
jgi:peptidyl-prolyl cis-trans isomerase C